MKKRCTCDIWKGEIGLLNSAVVLASSHGLSTGKYPFDYCPWCGKKLISEVSKT